MASINEKNVALGDKSKFQLILIGYDREKDGYEAYAKKMSFPAVTMESRNEGDVKTLVEAGSTGFLPNLVLLKPDGTMVSNDRKVVLEKLNEMVAD